MSLEKSLFRAVNYIWPHEAPVRYSRASRRRDDRLVFLEGGWRYGFD